MELESKLDFLDCGAIRIKGTRVGIEIILDDYLNGHSPEEIAVRYRHSLTLPQVYAAITYYHYNRDKMDAYLDEWRKEFEKDWQKQRHNPPPAIKHLLSIKARQTNPRSYNESNPLPY